DRVDELEVVVPLHVLGHLLSLLERLERLYVDLNVAVLTLSSGLLDVLVLCLRGSKNSLSVCNLRLANLRVDAEFSLHSVDHDLEMELAHSRDKSLASLWIGSDLEGWIFVRKLSERSTHLLLVRFGLRLDLERDHRLDELDRLEDDRIVLVAERVRGERFLEAHGCGNLSRKHLVYLLSIVRLKAHDSGEPLLLARSRVVYIRTGLYASRIYAEERELSDERVVLKLECKRAERIGIGRMPLDFVA